MLFLTHRASRPLTNNITSVTAATNHLYITSQEYLRQLQHDHYEYERRTVFQDMLANEQQQQAAHLKVQRSQAEIMAKRCVDGAC